jgi:hypothetical protein
LKTIQKFTVTIQKRVKSKKDSNEYYFLAYNMGRMKYLFFLQKLYAYLNISKTVIGYLNITLHSIPIYIFVWSLDGSILQNLVA